jgi:hypothetical protein
VYNSLEVEFLHAHFFFNGKYIINQASAQDEQRPIKKEIHKSGVVYR